MQPNPNKRSYKTLWFTGSVSHTPKSLTSSQIWSSFSRVRVSDFSGQKMAKRFYNEIKGLKVTEVPNHVKPMLSLDYVKKTLQKGLDNYNAKYIQTSSIDPLLHVCFGGMIFSYLVALPEERRHLEHAQHAKEHGGH